jgi:hypothetical protein
MGIVHTGESEYDKELARWNTPQRLGGHGPNGFQPFPRMVYKAYRRENGRVECMEPPPVMHLFATLPEFHRAEAIAKSFTDSCQQIVGSEAEYRRARDMGWRESPQDAIDHQEALAREIADAAAEANFSSRRMSPQAQAERDAAQAATDAHVVDPPVPPRRRYQRKPRVTTD